MIATALGILSATLFTLAMIGVSAWVVAQWKQTRRSLRPAMRTYGLGNKWRGSVR